MAERLTSEDRRPPAGPSRAATAWPGFRRRGLQTAARLLPAATARLLARRYVTPSGSFLAGPAAAGDRGFEMVTAGRQQLLRFDTPAATRRLLIVPGHDGHVPAVPAADPRAARHRRAGRPAAAARPSRTGALALQLWRHRRGAARSGRKHRDLRRADRPLRRLQRQPAGNRPCAAGAQAGVSLGAAHPVRSGGTGRPAVRAAGGWPAAFSGRGQPGSGRPIRSRRPGSRLPPAGANPCW